MKHELGVLLQFLVLTALPMLIYWQLTYGFKLIYMPALLLVGIVIFSVATRMREST